MNGVWGAVVLGYGVVFLALVLERQRRFVFSSEDLIYRI